MCQKSKVL